MRIVFAGGGTGGHVYPALAVARYLKAKKPDTEILFIGTERGMEKKLVPEAGFELETITVRGLKRRVSVDSLRVMWDLGRGYAQARRIIKNYNPHVVVGTGGYVSAPVLLAARRQGKRTIIHEQNVPPGMTNRLLSLLVHRVCVSFKASYAYFPRRAKLFFTGNPRGSEVLHYDRRRGCALLGLDPAQKIVVVVSGSRGAARVNKAVSEYLAEKELTPDVQFLYITGTQYHEQVHKGLAGAKELHDDRLHIVPYIKEMPAALAAADLVVTRAGATTLAEITAKGIPAIFIPSPNVTGDHQTLNAQMLADRGAAFLLPEDKLNAESLGEAIDKVLSSPEILERMAARSREMGTPDAGERFFRCIMEQVALTKKS